MKITLLKGRYLVRLPFFILIILAIFGLSACNTPTAAPIPTTQSVDLTFTQAAQTIIAHLTQSAPTNTPAQNTPEPAVTSTDTSNLESSPTAENTLQLEPTGTNTPTLPPTPTLAPWKLVFQDDFSGKVSWYEYTGDQYGFQLHDNHYRGYVDFIYGAIISVKSGIYSDVRVQASAEYKSGPQSGFYGVACRQLDLNNYYALVISLDGSYGIARMISGSFEFIQEDKDTQNIILQGSQINQIGGDCVGNHLILYANGQQLLDVKDDTFQQGEIGLVVGTRASGGIEMQFDDVAVYETQNQ